MSTRLFQRGGLPALALSLISALAAGCGGAPGWTPDSVERIYRLAPEQPALEGSAYENPPEPAGTVTSGDNLVRDLSLTGWGGGVLVEDLLGSPQLRLFEVTGDGANDLSALDPEEGYEWAELSSTGDQLWAWQGQSSRVSLQRIEQGGEQLPAVISPELNHLFTDRGYLFDLAPNRVRLFDEASEEPVARAGVEGETGLDLLGWEGEDRLLVARQRSVGVLEIGGGGLQVRNTLNRQVISSGSMEAAALVEPQELAFVAGGLSPELYLYDLEEREKLWQEPLPSPSRRYRIYPVGDRIVVVGYQTESNQSPSVQIDAFERGDGSHLFNHRLDPQAHPLSLHYREASDELLVTELFGVDQTGGGYPDLQFPFLLAPGPDPDLSELHTRITALDFQGNESWQLDEGDSDFLVPVNRELLVGVDLGTGVFPPGFKGFDPADGSQLWQRTFDSGEVTEFGVGDPLVGAILRESGQFRVEVLRFEGAPASPEETDNQGEEAGTS